MRIRMTNLLKRCYLLAVVVSACVATVLAADAQTPRQFADRIALVPQDHPLVPALKAANDALKKVASLNDYEALFIKKEYVEGTFIEQKMNLRYRRQPMSVYVKFVEPHEGRQVIYEQGKNGGQMQVKDTGLASLVGTVNIDPNGSLAMSETKYPITMIGMENMTRRVIEEWLKATVLDDITVKFYPNARIGNVACEVIESTHPDPVTSKGIYRARLYIDKTSGLPIRVQEFGFPKQAGGQPPVVSDYAYLNVRTDVGLTAADFDLRTARSGF